MQQPAAATPSPTSSSFAGLLADLARPEPAPGKKFAPARDLDGLEDDVATLSYEHALRAHARYRPEPAPGPRPAPAPESNPLERPPGTREPYATQAAGPRPAPSSTAPMEPRRSASVTVRLSQDEDDRLRQRAAEAGMTVSAYLRSCAFEVETLRAQVKQTLAEMRHSSRRPGQLSLWNRLVPWKKRTVAAGRS